MESGQLTSDFPGIPSIHTLFNERSRGAAGARNQALAEAQGELIAFLDDDDLWFPDYLQQQLMQLEAAGGRVLCTACGIRCQRTFIRN
jgi:glycosyltransferase involved in cell wall biosynthesis